MCGSNKSSVEMLLRIHIFVNLRFIFIRYSLPVYDSESSGGEFSIFVCLFILFNTY